MRYLNVNVLAQSQYSIDDENHIKTAVIEQTCSEQTYREIICYQLKSTVKVEIKICASFKKECPFKTTSRQENQNVSL